MKTRFLAVTLGLAARAVLAHPGHDGEVRPDLSLLAAVAPGATDGAPTDFSAQSRVSITAEGEFRIIRSNDLPDHPAGQFPNRHNPNSITAQNFNFKVPLKPQLADRLTVVGMQLFGVAVNGVVFDPAAAEWWNRDRSSGWQYDPLSGAINLGNDINTAHVQPNGMYHYHGIPTGLVNRLTGGQPKVALVGWSADGFPLYGPWGYSNANDARSELKKLKSSYQLKKGTRPSGPGGKYDGSFVEDYEYVAGSGDLDECNGRSGVTPDYPAGIYHYYLTAEFPNIPRYYRGTPDQSFRHRGPPGGGRPGGPGGFGPPNGPGGPDRPPRPERQ